ncbi:hypothetical protein CANINC_003435 [Pichia inconspicua]|uniref:Uncharacterized protein n=1 Tax=Pichia inconspicua TaxID=52247 RepID=A0A4T0WZP5_9ASCO|nr:hypothetical protein CANINC_003435 [[Candida] inconspicua]
MHTMNDLEVVNSAKTSSKSLEFLQGNSVEGSKIFSSSSHLPDDTNNSISVGPCSERMKKTNTNENSLDVAELAKKKSEPNDVSKNESVQGRPRRKATKSVNYTEKMESDIPAIDTDKNELKRSRRKTSPNERSYSSHTNSSSDAKMGSYYNIEEIVPTNYQPPIKVGDNFNEMMDLKTAKVDVNEITLTLKTGETIKKGDCIYMICEPPSDPFYIAKVLGFTKKDINVTVRNASNYNFSVCWFYRPRDLNRRSVDSRLVYASLHRDTCPIASYRGKVTVKHKSEIGNLDEYRKMPDCFYFDKLYDRYMIKMYDMIPTKKLTHLPPNYFTALNKRFEFVFVEVGKADELLSSPKNCEKCLQWCSSADSILCLGCQKSYHLLCLDPPILTKPKRGFAWYCASCNNKLEEKLAENRGNMLESLQPSEIVKVETLGKRRSNVTEASENDVNLFDANEDAEFDSSSLSYEQAAKKFLEADQNISLKRRREMEEWPYRYLGVHAKFEDALDLQDRPYARAASRLGSKYQCSSVVEWYGYPVKYYDVEDQSGNAARKSKKVNSRNKKLLSSTKVESNIPSDQKFPIPDKYKSWKPKDYPGWLQPKPKGYVERGGEETSTLLWKMPPKDYMEEEEAGLLVQHFIEDCAGVAKRLKLTSTTTPNFIDAILLILMNNDYDTKKSLNEVQHLTRESLKEPSFTEDEVQRFEDSVRIHGSELYPVYKDVKTQPSAMVVRFYYLWKKTKMGHEIWDNFPGRAKNKVKSTDDFGFDLEDPQDDGSFSNSKITKSNYNFKCVYCEADHSTAWFKAPGATKIEADRMCEGLCRRCAKLWRKYAVKWENPVELIKSLDKKNGNYSLKKRFEFALVQEAEDVLKARENYLSKPKKKSEKLKKFKTIDSDYDYNFFTPRGTKRTLNKTMRIEPESKQASTIFKLNPSNQLPAKNKMMKKENKLEIVSSNRQSMQLNEEASEVQNSIVVTETQPKKRKYMRKKKTENGLTFIVESSIAPRVGSYQNTETNESEKKLPTSYEYGRVSQLKSELETTMNQLHENNESNFFNAFLDMKLRERIESLEKELSMFEGAKLSKIVESKPTDIAKLETATNDSKKKHAKRRLYLSKTSVPGTGVFETPPIQLPSELETSDPADSDKNMKFVFHMYERKDRSTANSNINTNFQIQPNLPPSTLLSTVKILNKESPSALTTSNEELTASDAKKPTLIFKSTPDGTASNSNHTDTETCYLKDNKRAIKAQPSSSNSAVLTLVDLKDEVTKKMMARYISKFEIFNPLLYDDCTSSPIYQLRPSSKELSLLWKQYQAARKSKGRSIKEFQPLYNADSRSCCVCRELGDIKKMLICSNCGLNVHSTCYGINLDSSITNPASEFNWHCDPCSNDLHPLASTQYACLLCNSRESYMDQAIRGDPASIPDALKRTSEGRWCHITCALMCDEIKFGSHSLQPVIGTHAVGVKNIFQICEMCSTYGGAIPQCEFCERKSHVTCALDYGWKIAFKLLPIFKKLDGNIVKIKNADVVGKIHPIIYCDEHKRSDKTYDFSNIYDLNELAEGMDQNEKENCTLLELYLADPGKLIINKTSVSLLKMSYKALQQSFEELASRSSDRIVEEIEALKSQLKSPRCSECFKTSSLIWYPNKKEGEMCHLCYSKKHNHLKDDIEIPDFTSVDTCEFDASKFD